MRRLLADIEFCRWFDRKHRGRGLLLNPKLARTKSQRRYQQILGKALRLHPDEPRFRLLAAELSTL